MKKSYVKPELFFESFRLTTHIAACRWDIRDHTAMETCVADWDPDLNNSHNTGHTIFVSNEQCVTKPENLEEYCYTNGADANRIFQS